jgi:hypothetical protein
MKRRSTSRRTLIALWSSAVLVCGLLVPGALLSQERHAGARTDLNAQAESIRRSAAALAKVQRIPWVTDVAEGFRLAKEERRPVFLYVITGDPLGDC